MSRLVTPFVEALDRQTDRLRSLSGRGRKILGYFCTYTPVELIHASGFVPVRIIGGSGPISMANSYAPSFICPYMRRALEKALAGEYTYLSGLVQGYTCDVACGMMRIWEEHFRGELFHILPLPYENNTDSRRFFRSALDELKTALERIGGNRKEEALDESLRLYERLRRVILDLYETRYRREIPFSAGDFLTVIQAGFVTPPEEYLDMLGDLRLKLDTAERPDSAGIPVMVSGSLIEDPRVLEILESAGGRVVADDLCTGLRNFSPAGGDGTDPMDRLIDRYINRFPCPARSRSTDRLPLLLQLVERSGAKGVVFLFQKFCTPHLADHPTLREELRKNGVPSVAVEMEESGINEGQLRTRLEAFFEIVGA